MKILLILLISSILLTNARYSARRNRRGGSRNRQSRKRNRDYNQHNTRSCNSATTKCTCENRPYEVKTGNDQYGFDDQYNQYSGPIITTDYSGNQVSCFHYTVARIENKYDLCSDKTLKSVIIGLDPSKASCKKMGCSDYQNVVSSMSCKCGCSKCCTTSIASDTSLNIYGVKFSFAYAIDTNSQEVELEICLKGSGHNMLYGGGLIAFSSTDTSGFACDSYNIPNFCDGPGGPVPDCEAQDKCVEFDMSPDYDYMGNFNGYEVCFWWTQYGNPECGKEDSISHFCYNPGYYKQKIEDWSPGSKTCVVINCGETATFGVKDGQGCNSYSGLLTKRISNGYGCQDLIGRCSYKDGYEYPCPGSNTGAGNSDDNGLMGFKMAYKLINKFT